MTAAAALVLMTGGCSAEPTALPCTLIGGLDGVGVEFSEIRSVHPRAVLVVDACVANVCRRFTNKPRDPRLTVEVWDESVTDSAVAATLKIWDAGGAVLFDDRLTVHPVKRLPNGPGCPPTTWSAQVRATEKGRLALAEAP